MNRVLLSIRVTRYQALIRVIEIGLTSIMQQSAGSGGVLGGDDIVARLSALEALADRGLFTASAAYVYARRAALHSEGDADKLDAALGEAVQSAYARQRALASETL
jgi:hypothetical protein